MARPVGFWCHRSPMPSWRATWPTTGRANRRDYGSDLLRYAARHHDDGWAAWDQRPGVDEQGVPVNLDQMRLVDSLSIWERSIELSTIHSPLAGYLVAGHFSRLLGRFTSWQKNSDTRLLATDFLTMQAAKMAACAGRLAVWRPVAYPRPGRIGGLAGPAVRCRQPLVLLRRAKRAVAGHASGRPSMGIFARLAATSGDRSLAAGSADACCGRHWSVGAPGRLSVGGRIGVRFGAVRRTAPGTGASEVAASCTPCGWPGMDTVRVPSGTRVFRSRASSRLTAAWTSGFPAWCRWLAGVWYSP